MSTGSQCALVTVAGLNSAQGLLSHMAFGWRLGTPPGRVREILKEGEGDTAGTGVWKGAIGDILQAGVELTGKGPTVSVSLCTKVCLCV